jgi:hypothetical protein
MSHKKAEEKLNKLEGGGAGGFNIFTFKLVKT